MYEIYRMYSDFFRCIYYLMTFQMANIELQLCTERVLSFGIITNPISCNSALRHPLNIA